MEKRLPDLPTINVNKPMDTRNLTTIELALLIEHIWTGECHHRAKRLQDTRDAIKSYALQECEKQKTKSKKQKS